jgi:hypothetical protein
MGMSVATGLTLSSMSTYFGERWHSLRRRQVSNLYWAALLPETFRV